MRKQPPTKSLTTETVIRPWIQSTTRSRTSQITRFQHRRKIMFRRKWAHASQSSPRRDPARPFWMANHHVKQMRSKIYSNQPQIYLATMHFNLTDLRMPTFSNQPRRVRMLRLKSFSEVTQCHMRSNRATISRLRIDGPTCSVQCMAVRACPTRSSAVMITRSWRKATRKTDVASSTSHRPSSRAHSKFERRPLAYSGPTEKVHR